MKKITTATLISALALGISATAFAQDNPTIKLVTAADHTIRINAVLTPTTPEAAKPESFHVNRAAALNTSLQNVITSRQLEEMPLSGNNPLNAIAAH